METKRAFIAVIISLVILVGYQYFFMPGVHQPPVQQQKQQPARTTAAPQLVQPAPRAAAPQLSQPAAAPATTDNTAVPSAAMNGRDITVRTSLYTAVISENGGVIKSFTLNKYRESLAADSPRKELIKTSSPQDLPLNFYWGQGGNMTLPLFKANRLQVTTSPNGQQTLTMSATLKSGLKIQRIMTFTDNSYLIGLTIKVENKTLSPLRGAPYLQLINRPFAQGSSKTSFLFNGPASYVNGKLEEIKPKTLRKKGPEVFQGKLDWAAYEGTYFMCGIIPQTKSPSTVQMALTGKDTIITTVSGSLSTISAGNAREYSYGLYFGPKKLSILKDVGFNLDKTVNFGWFDLIAKPTLYLLNFLDRYVHNYGVAIILVTILFKLILWPISHKGMKSMKTMQKIQPKMAKLREKYKDNKDKLNQEMILLYKTYKINPLGGCLPMVVQIPVFFALYRVLLQTIELRHAPFMLWINDLSAPDRLSIGFNIPYLHGIPVLTLLMGVSMFVQQKMTPTTGDPTQAKIMLFLPVVFTFMFLNFASGLVLYWFVNNLLSIGQQYYINKSIDD